jgi:hypothetical protein
VAVFVALGTADAMLWTVFAYPFEALANVEHAPLKRLIIMIGTFVGDFVPWLIFLVLALPLFWRRGGPLIVRLLWTWLIVVRRSSSRSGRPGGTTTSCCC